MNFKNKANEIVNKFYQPLGKLKCSVSKQELWQYAKTSAIFLVDEIIDSEALEPQLKRHIINDIPPIKCQLEYWMKVKKEIIEL